MSRRPSSPLRATSLALVLLFALGACGSSGPTGAPTAVSGTGAPGTGSPTASGTVPATGEPAPTTTATPEPTPTPVPTPVTVPAPLDGLPVSPAAAARHPIAVMIDDLSAARPQSGFSAASIVWQAPAEGGIPRYMLIFGETRPTDVGPVRSSRYYFIVWAAEWKAVYTHAGGSPQALQTLRQYGSGKWVYNADEFAFGGSFWRITTKAPPHNLYTTGKELDALAARLGAKTGVTKPIWQFAPDAPLEQRPVGGKISFRYPTSAISYAYDRATNTYLRTVSVVGAQKDAANGLRVAPKNVIVMLMRFAPLNGSPAHGRLEAQVVGSGVAWISTNGVTVKGTWRKKSVTDPTLFYDSKGSQVTFTAGQTFINVLQTGSVVTIVKGSPPPAAASPSPSLSPAPTATP